MTFVPQQEERNCFIACSKEKVDSGLCDCVNRMKNLSFHEEKHIEQLAKEYAKSVTKNETYQEYLEKAFVAGAKYKEEYYEKFLAIRDAQSALWEDSAKQNIQTIEKLKSQQQEIWNAARKKSYFANEIPLGSEDSQWEHETLQDYLNAGHGHGLSWCSDSSEYPENY